MYRTILVATDGSRGSAAAVDHALDLAERHGATVHAIHVVEDLGGVTAFGRPEIHEELRARGERLVAAVRERARERGVDPVTAVLDGSPAEGIVDYAREEDVDLVVLGTHGRTGLQRYLLGSVAERVVRTAPAPVLTLSPEVRPVSDDEEAQEAARDALQRAGYGGVTVLESPSRQRDTWVVRAEADGERCNVHVSADGHTRIAHLPDE